MPGPRRAGARAGAHARLSIRRPGPPPPRRAPRPLVMNVSAESPSTDSELRPTRHMVGGGGRAFLGLAVFGLVVCGGFLESLVLECDGLCVFR